MKTTLAIITCLLTACATDPTTGKSTPMIPITVGASYVGDGYTVNTSYNSQGGINVGVVVDPTAKPVKVTKTAQTIPVTVPTVIPAK